MNLPSEVSINEVLLRDGLQLEDLILSVKEKSLLFDHLVEAGVQSAEFGAFVNPEKVPQMKNSAELFAEINKKAKHVQLLALVPNLKGAKKASKNGVKNVNFVFSASDTHNMQNVNKSTMQSIEELRDLNYFCMENEILLNVSIATTFGCPFEGEISEDRIMWIMKELSDFQIDMLTLADTTGMANPRQVYQLLKLVLDEFPEKKLNLHFHNTRGMGLANILAGINAGVHRYDTALGGLGGCPFAPGATGNVCTEDVVHMLHNMGVKTNINLDKLLEASKVLEEVIGHKTPSYLLKAGPSDRKYPVPS